MYRCGQRQPQREKSLRLSRYGRRYGVAAERKEDKRQQKNSQLDKRIPTAQRKEK